MQGVSLFYGGFNQNNNTQICSLHNGIFSSFEYVDDARLDSELSVFCNCSVQGKNLVDFITDDLINNQPDILPPIFKPDQSIKKKQNIYLSHPNYRNVLSTIVPNYRTLVHNDLGRDTYIGENFDCIVINKPALSTPLTHVAYYIDSLNHGFLSPYLFPSTLTSNYADVKTVEELETARQDGNITYYDQTHSLFMLQSMSNVP